MSDKIAFITGVTGMDGSHLVELLLEKGYKVHGMIRRSSSFNTQRIEHVINDIHLHYGDLTDGSNVSRLLDKIQPNEVYNLGAQSHVQVSFEVPEYSANADGLGALRLLDAIKELKLPAKYYQASTSEMFGKVREVPQNENTPFYPRSPYGVAKLYAYWITVNFREAYNLFACNGILFNHETLTYSTPVIIRNDDKTIEILPIGDVCRFKTGIDFDLKNLSYQEGVPKKEIEIWDNNKWTRVKFVSGYPHKQDKNPRIVNSRNMVYSATGSHQCIMEDGSECSTSELIVGNKVKLIDYPESFSITNISLEEAEFLGMLVGDGGFNHRTPRFTGKDMELKKHFEKLWTVLCPHGYCKYSDSYSGFTNEFIGQVEARGVYDKNIDIYTHDISVFGHKYKKVPKEILNASKDVMEAFLIGYNNCDGLKSSPCKYRFKNFKTNSPSLAAGLLFLVSKVTGQKYNITVEESWAFGKQQFYYSINLLSDNQSSIEKYIIVKDLLSKNLSQREIYRQTKISREFIRKVFYGYIPSYTHHLELPNNEIKKIIDIPNYDGWFFDLETESGTFHAGIGQGLVHNSERRGETFVTRKITKAVARIKNGIQDKLFLGNLSAKRDWGYAPEYVKAMWLMLQQDNPDDYVLATGETHTVEEFCSLAFNIAGIQLVFEGDGVNRKGIDSNGIPRVVIDPKHFRPSEVDLLLGDASKAKRVLGWEPQVKFEELVKIMVEYDLYRY